MNRHGWVGSRDKSVGVPLLESASAMNKEVTGKMGGNGVQPLIPVIIICCGGSTTALSSGLQACVPTYRQGAYYYPENRPGSWGFLLCTYRNIDGRRKLLAVIRAHQERGSVTWHLMLYCSAQRHIGTSLTADARQMTLICYDEAASWLHTCSVPRTWRMNDTVQRLQFHVVVVVVAASAADINNVIGRSESSRAWTTAHGT